MSIKTGKIGSVADNSLHASNFPSKNPVARCNQVNEGVFTMKIRSTFHASVFLIAVFVFSMPVVIFAQQNAEVPASKATIEPDKLQAIVATAKADAERDVNGVIWFAGSFLGSVVGGTVVVYSCGTYALASATADIAGSCLGGEAGSVDSTPFLFIGGCGLALFSLPIAYALLDTPSPASRTTLGQITRVR